LNDLFDRELDAVERPERPIPSGAVSPAGAAVLGGVLLAAGVGAASQATAAAAALGVAIAALVVLYDVWGKRHAVFGPVNMGLCRALNLLLGIAAVPAALAVWWPLAILPFVYIAAVTTVSRAEVRGGKVGAATPALISLAGVVLALAAVGLRAGSHAPAALVLTAALGWRVLPRFWSLRQVSDPAAIRLAVKTGVLSLVLVDAAISAAYAGPLYSAVVLATAVTAGWLARLFSVT
jgi:4-hydroxybenzoate polyprenyltransferase